MHGRRPTSRPRHDARELNRPVDRIDTLVHDAYATVDALMAPMTGRAIDVNAFRRADRPIVDLIAAEPGYAGYLRMRLASAVDELASIAAGLCGFPGGFDTAALVMDVVRRWAAQTPTLDGASSRRTDFLETFDRRTRGAGSASSSTGWTVRRRDVEGRTTAPLPTDIRSRCTTWTTCARDIRRRWPRW